MHFSKRFVGYVSMAALLLFVAGGSAYVYFTRYHGISYRIAFADDIGNLKIENAVTVHGVVAGKVWDIRRENNKAKITLRMEKAYPIRKDYVLLNKDASLMGDRGLYLDLGTSDSVLPDDAPLFATFATGIAEGIRNADTLRVIVDDLYALLEGLSAKDSLNDTLFTTYYWNVIRGLDRASRQLEEMLAGKETMVNRFVDATSEFSSATREQVRTLTPAARTGVVQADKMSKSLAELLTKLEPLVDQLTVYVDATTRGDNKLGKLLQDKEARDKLLKMVQQIRTLVGVMQEDGVKLEVHLF